MTCLVLNLSANQVSIVPGENARREPRSTFTNQRAWESTLFPLPKSCELTKLEYQIACLLDVFEK